MKNSKTLVNQLKKKITIYGTTKKKIENKSTAYLKTGVFVQTIKCCHKNFILSIHTIQPA